MSSMIYRPTYWVLEKSLCRHLNGFILMTVHILIFIYSLEAFNNSSNSLSLLKYNGQTVPVRKTE